MMKNVTKKQTYMEGGYMPNKNNTKTGDDAVVMYLRKLIAEGKLNETEVMAAVKDGKVKELLETNNPTIEDKPSKVIYDDGGPKRHTKNQNMLKVHFIVRIQVQ